jgi:hypothetical protein
MKRRAKLVSRRASTVLAADSLPGGDQHLASDLDEHPLVHGQKKLPSLRILIEQDAGYQGSQEVDVPWQQAERTVGGFRCYLGGGLVHDDAGRGHDF